jgi:mRNA interferase HigB
MWVLSKPILKKCWEQHPEVKGQLEAWYDHVKHADWHTPADVQKDYGPDVILPDNRAVFNIKGNKYRIVVRFNYPSQRVFIRFVGTHDEYNEIDATTI